VTEVKPEEHKSKIKKVMIDHLTSLGYPDMTTQEIMAQLKPMWIKLEEANLVIPGMTLQGFAEHATNEAMKADLMNLFGVSI
jgi:hypothetical protein